MYLEVVIKTSTIFSEIAANVLVEFGSEGVAIYDRNDFLSLARTNKTWDYVSEKLQKDCDDVLVVGGLDENTDISELRRRIQEAVSLFYVRVSAQTFVTKLDQNEWQQKYFATLVPIKIGKLEIVPYDDGLKASQEQLLIERGMAFGTGEHETTAMCLELLQELDLQGKTVLDVGTGSGILGLAALKLGAKSAYLIDNDSLCVQAARKNASLNELKPFIIKNNLLNHCAIKADLMLANLTADIILKLMPAFSLNLLPSGKAIISGIINSRKDEVVEMLEKNKIVFEKIIQRGEWSAAIIAPKGCTNCAQCGRCG